MAVSKNGPNPQISVGESCPLVNENPGATTFRRVLVTPEEGGRRVLYLVKEGQSPQSAHDTMEALQPLSFQLGEETTKDEVDEAFENCPCKDRANCDQCVGAAGCLAINSLLER